MATAVGVNEATSMFSVLCKGLLVSSSYTNVNALGLPVTRSKR
jgi:hypothetical protein